MPVHENSSRRIAKKFRIFPMYLQGPFRPSANWPGHVICGYPFGSRLWILADSSVVCSEYDHG